MPICPDALIFGSERLDRFHDLGERLFDIILVFASYSCGWDIGSIDRGRDRHIARRESCRWHWYTESCLLVDIGEGLILLEE